MKIKKYCLLKNGTIESCYYENGELRNIYKEDDKWYLDHDVFLNYSIAYCHSEIVKFSDNKKELEDDN